MLGKPARHLLEAAKNLDVAPSSCVVVEDTVSKIQSAHAAGIGYVVGMASVATREELELLATPGSSRPSKTLATFPREFLFDERRSH